MRAKKELLYLAIAVAALVAGADVYLAIRACDHAYFLKAFAGGGAATRNHPALTGQIPAFLHALAFVLVAAAVTRPRTRRSVLRLGAAWFALAALFEIGQYQPVARLIAAAIPGWFARVPVLDNAAAYFLRGTFDWLDLAAAALGALTACVVVLAVEGAGGSRAAETGPRRRLWLVPAVLAAAATTIASGGGGGAGGTSTATTQSRLYVVGGTTNQIESFVNANTASGSVSPDRTITAGALSSPRGIAVDMPHNRIYVANYADNTVLVFANARSATGAVSPIRTITGFNGPAGLSLDVTNDRLYVTDLNDDTVAVIDGASTETTVTRTLFGGGFNQPSGIAIDVARNLLYVANAGGNSISVIADAATASGSVTALHTVTGSLAAPAGMFLDAAADRLYVANSTGPSVFVYDNAHSADGIETPSRALGGTTTSFSHPGDIFVDTGTNRLYVTDSTADTVLVFNNASSANGDVAPNRTISLATLTGPAGVFVDVTPIVLPSTAALDGYVTFDGASVTTPDTTGGEPMTGDTGDAGLTQDVTARQFYSFGLENFPTTLTVTSASLHLYQAAVTGTPYGLTLGNVIVDHVSFGTTPDTNVYSNDTLAANIGTLSSDATIGYKTLSVTDSVASDLTGARSRSQFRLEFSPHESTGGGAAYAQFTDAEDNCCNVREPPQLLITVVP